MSNSRIEHAVRGADWWELAGHDADGLRLAWDELLHAVQPVAEVGKAIGPRRDDGLEACMGFYPGAGLLEAFFAGMTVGTSPAVRAAVRLWERRLYLIETSGAVVAERDLEGITREQATGWLLDAAMNAIDEPLRYATEPEQGLPEHAIAKGGVFGAPNQLAQAEIIRLYGNTASVLDACRSGVAIEDWEPGPTVVNSNRLEMSADFVSLGRDARSSVRIGLRPPMQGRPACWFAVSIDGGPVMETLSVGDVAADEDPAVQASRVAGLVAKVLPATEGLL